MRPLFRHVRSAAGLAAGALLAVVGCTGPQNALDVAGPAASGIADLWWLMLAIASAVCVVVIALLAVAVSRSRQRRGGGEVQEVDAKRLVWAGGVILPALILVSVLAYSYRAGAAVYPPLREADALTVDVIGHQFWWEVRYPDDGFITANEIVIPAGRPVRFRVTAPDVIHSFWIPRLHGKIDMIPGRLNTIWIHADEPGLFRGQCAEFCGMGHALMAMWVEALPEAEFGAWVERRRAAATAPHEPPPEARPRVDRPEPQRHPSERGLRRGREVFFEAGCGDCHATRGVPLPASLGVPAPDLRGLAERRTIAAGTLPNTRESLRLWVTDPERIKPGARMPPTPLAAQEMEALLDYLEGL